MRRREMALGAAAAALAGPAATQNRVRRIGLIRVPVLTEQDRRRVIDGLQKAGAVEGRDYVLLVRSADGDLKKVPHLARELVAEGAEIIITTGDVGRPVLHATTAVPVVAFGMNPDALAAEGFRSRMAGVDMQNTPFSQKRLELLSSCLPRGARVLMVAEARHREHASRRAVEQAAAQLGVELHPSWCDTAADLPAALALARRVKAVGLYQHYGSVMNSLSGQLIELAKEARLADMYEWPASARLGGLMGYGPDRDELTRQFYALAWRIAQGEKPDSLPFEGPMRVHLALNMARARSLGLRVPRTLLARADEVIE
jgi:putative tryptophan/tyrosine transport system substrate-binding protein